MGNKLVSMLLFLLLSLTVFSQKTGNFIDKTVYYNIFASNDLASVDKELAVLKTATDKDAFTGALLMKKAGLVFNPKNKLSLFKQGGTLLEDAISKSSSNVEYRFLRLMVQENAPGFLNYNDHMLTDSQVIKISYKSLPDPVLQAVKDYSKKSKFLKPADFQ